MARSGKANQGGGSNRQGPKVTSGGKRGPITQRMTGLGKSDAAPWGLSKGTNKPKLKGSSHGGRGHG